MPHFHAAAAAAFALALQGCASIVGGGPQPLSVQSMHSGQLVPGAACSLTNDKGTWFLSTPGSASVSRSTEPMIIKCTKEALPPGQLEVTPSMRAMVLGNALFGGLVGLVVDGATGASHEYPDLVTVMMGELAPIKKPVEYDIKPYVNTTAAGYSGSQEAVSRPVPASPAPPRVAAAPAAAYIAPAPSAAAPTADPASAKAPDAPTPSAAGLRSEQVLALPAVKTCHSRPAPVLTERRGQAQETYHLRCENGSTLVVQCQWHGCAAAQ